MDMYKTETGMSSRKPYPGAPKLVSTKRIGERRENSGRDCTFIVQDALHTFSDGSTRRSSGYYQEVEVPEGLEGHDICLYCGADNGPNGEYRIGWSCCYCGSN